VPGTLCAHERMLIPIADQIASQLFAEGDPHFLCKHYGWLIEQAPADID
jgi:hypothetical protein